MAKDSLQTSTDPLQCRDHLLLQLHQTAQIQHFGRSSKRSTKMVFQPHDLFSTLLICAPGSGQLTEQELRAALVNGDWSSFDPHTVKMMIRMFDTDRSGSIGFDEFCGLWGFLAAWRSLFDRFDVDRSGNISLDEYTNALVAFGYRLSPQFVDTLFRTYDKRGEGAISFDLFVQSCISLKRMTDVFKKYDDDRDGFITLSL
jgi:Ca2+-binding EF-hand superfamily protein